MEETKVRSDYAEIHLPYFKQGDDLAHYLEECKEDVVSAILSRWKKSGKRKKRR